MQRHDRRRLPALGALVLSLFAAAVLALGVDSGSSANPRIVLRLGTTQSTTTAQYRDYVAFAKKVKRLTGGRLQIALYPNSQLGSAETMLTAIEQGSLPLTITDSATLEAIYGQMAVLDLPFTFSSLDQQEKVVLGPVGTALNKGLIPRGVNVIGWGTLGSRDILAKPEINSIADLKGLKIRTIISPTFEGAMTSMGMNPVGTSVADIYPSLATGVVDAVELSPEILSARKLYEVARNLVLTQHLMQTNLIAMSQKVLRGLPKSYQAALLKAGREFAELEFKRENERMAAGIADLRAHDVKVTLLPRKALVQLVRPYVRQQIDKMGLEKLYAQVAKVTGG